MKKRRRRKPKQNGTKKFKNKNKIKTQTNNKRKNKQQQKTDKAVDKKKARRGRDKSGVIGLHVTEVEKTKQTTPPPP